MNDAQRRLRQAEQRLNALEQKLADSNKLLEENNRPTLSGLGTRVEQILRASTQVKNTRQPLPATHSWSPSSVTRSSGVCDGPISSSS